MNLTSASTLLTKPPLLTGTDSSMQTTSGNYQDRSLTRPDNSIVFPTFKTPNPFLREAPQGNFQVLDDDDDLVMYEPVKKTRVEDHNMNMLTGSNSMASQLPRDKTFRKPTESQSYRAANGLTQFERPTFEDQKFSKEASENLSTYNSNSSFSEHALKREIIDLEDDAVIVDKKQGTKERASDSLVVTDDVLGNLNRTKDQLLQQLMLRNLLGQQNLPQQKSMMDPQTSLLAAQLMQANQFNQFNPRGYMNPLANSLFGNPNPLMMNNLRYSMQLSNLARQAQFPFPTNDFPEPSSITGKRHEPYNGFESLVRPDNYAQQKPSDAKNRTEIILLDDDEEDPRAQTRAGNIAFWERYQNKKVFKIEKTKRKPIVKKKKLVFTIIKYKPGQKPFTGFIGKKKAMYLASLNNRAGGTGPESEENISDQGLRRSSRRLRNTRIEESSAFRESMAIRALREARDFKPVIEDYVIKIHVDEDAENEDISETPIGDSFQVKLVPFCIDMETTRSVKSVWDPDSINDEFIQNCLKKIENKFDRKTVGEEIFLKTLKKYEMDVDKVIEELETNKMTFRSFFEVRQKVLRSRVLQHHIQM